MSGLGMPPSIRQRLSAAARPALVWVLIAAPAVLGLVFFAAERWKDIASAYREAAGATYLEQIWTAAGSPSAWTAGTPTADASFGASQASAVFQRAVSRHERLAAGADLIVAVADGSNLTLDPDLDSFYVMDAVTVRLPALRLAVDGLDAAAGERSVSRDVDIAVATQALATAELAANRSLDKAMSNNSSGRVRLALGARTNSLQLAMARLREQAARAQADPSANAGAARNVAQAEIDATWRAATTELRRLLQARVDSFLGLLALSLAICIVTLAAAQARRRRLETETSEERRKAEVAEAASSMKSEFLANMSHELRTPLNGVIGVVDALARTELSAAQREMAELIQGSGATLARLVSDVLDISKIEAGRLELELRPFDLREALGGVLDVARIGADEKGLAFSVDYGATARGLFLGDSVRIKQVLGNLLSNALKFTATGQVAVRVEVLEPDRADALARLSLAVRDTGVGFDPATAAALFERFSQADNTITRRFGGTGLGLAITKSLVELMAGQIHTRSHPGEGATFSVSIPLPRSLALADYDQRFSAAPTVAPQGDGAGTLDEGRPMRILLAEDNPTNQKVVALILAPCGVDLTVVENGALAVEAFKAAMFDLVLMDMQMPVMDGLTAIRALRAHERSHPERPRTAVAMLSANAMQHHCEDAAQAGADLHIAKPSTARALIEGIQQAMTLSAAIEEAGMEHAVGQASLG